MKRGVSWIIAWLPWLGALALVVYGWATGASRDAGEFASAFYAIGDFVTGAFAVGQTVAGVYSAGMIAAGFAAAGVFAAGIYAAGIFAFGAYATGVFAFGYNATRLFAVGRQAVSFAPSGLSTTGTTEGRRNISSLSVWPCRVLSCRTCK